MWIGRKRLPCYRSYDAIHRQACALLEIFDGLFRCRIEGTGDIAGREHLHHYKDTLQSSYVVTSRTDTECWTAIHNFVATCSGRLSHPYLREKQPVIQVSLHGLALLRANGANGMSDMAGYAAR